MFSVATTLLSLGAGTAPVTSPSEAPTNKNPQLLDLSPIHKKRYVAGFSNPFRQYEGGTISGWQYGGDATLANDYLALTPPAPNRIGHIWTTEPHKLDAWEIEFEFHIGGAQQRGTGGGLALWWTSEPPVPGAVYGHSDHYKGVGIFFDTYEPEPGLGHTPGNEPYIVAMVNDGSTMTLSQLQDSTEMAKKQAAVCFAHYRNLPHVARARVAWSHGVLKLWLDTEASHVWQPCLETATGDERMASMPKKEDGGYFGVTASTGAFGDAHVLYSMAIAELGDSASEDIVATPHVAKEGEAAVPADHLVHKDAPQDHETHMKVMATDRPSTQQSVGAGETAEAAPAGAAAASADAAAQAAPHDGPEHPFPVHVPPTQSTDEKVESALSALQTSHELRVGIEGLKEEVASVTERMAAQEHRANETLHLLREIHTALAANGGGAVGGVVAAKQAPSSPSSPAAAAPALGGGGAGEAAAEGSGGSGGGRGLSEGELASLTSKLSEASLKTQGAALDEVKGLITAGHDMSKKVLDKMGKIDETLTEKLSSITVALTKLKQDVDGVRDVSRATVSELRSESAALKAALEEMHSVTKPSMLFPLAVCGQTLVVAALLFYAMTGAGRRKSSHLP